MDILQCWMILFKIIRTDNQVRIGQIQSVRGGEIIVLWYINLSTIINFEHSGKINFLWASLTNDGISKFQH